MNSWQQMEKTLKRWSACQLVQALWRYSSKKVKFSHELYRISTMCLITGCVNGDWLCQWEMAIFDPLQNRHPSTDHQKICHMWLRRRPLRLCQITCISVHGGLLGTWVKYNQNYFYLYPYLRYSPIGQTRRRIFAHDGSNDADSRKDVPFWEFFTLLPI